MRFAALLIFSFLVSACAAQPVASRKLVGDESNNSSSTNKTPILVELFTAEGCSSCPPAEKILAKLQLEQPFEKVEVITLALHVDYWDGLGWRDKFASPLHTQRQSVYDRKFRTGRIYTPQMIVDGDTEFVGSDFGKAEKAITKAIKAEKADLRLSIEEDKLRIFISNIPKHDQSTVYLALAEDDLSSDIRGGENAGKNLTHVSVVRRLKALDRLEATQISFEIEVPVQIAEDWKRENLNVIVFIQENKSRRILGVGRNGFRSEIASD